MVRWINPGSWYDRDCIFDYPDFLFNYYDIDKAMTTFDTIAMIIEYIVIAGIGIIALILIVATIFGHHRELNNQIYEKELMEKGIDPHIDPKFM